MLRPVICSSVGINWDKSASELFIIRYTYIEPMEPHEIICIYKLTMLIKTLWVKKQGENLKADFSPS